MLGGSDLRGEGRGAAAREGGEHAGGGNGGEAADGGGESENLGGGDGGREAEERREIGEGGLREFLEGEDAVQREKGEEREGGGHGLCRHRNFYFLCICCIIFIEIE